MTHTAPHPLRVSFAAMVILLDFIYSIALVLALPYLVYKSWRTGKYRTDLKARFGIVTPPAGPGWHVRDDFEELKTQGKHRRLMLHCVSVGELLSTRKLVDRLLVLDPHLQIILTTTTDTGTTRARELYLNEKYRARVSTYRYPLDFSFAVDSFFNTTQPDLIALVELETWPNFIAIAESKDIPVIIINGRVTERSFRKYLKVKPVIAKMMRRIAFIGAQTPAIADRFTQLGAPPERLATLPTIKYDAADFADSVRGADLLAAALGITAEHQLLVGGSTGPGEEVFLIQTYQALKEKYPALRLAIAPRKPETVFQVVTAIVNANLNPVSRTQHPDVNGRPTPLSQKDVIVLDTLGELKKLYSLAFANFIGRTLIPLGGSDMIESAALAKPTCFGPSTYNFAEPSELLTTQSAAFIVEDQPALTARIDYWLTHPGEARESAQRARAIIAAHCGSTEIYVQKILSLLPQTRPS